MSGSNELYVDIPGLREVPERFYNLKKQAMEKVALLESSEKYLRFHLSGSEDLCAEVRRIQSELEGIGTTFEQMGQVLETICNLYAACESKEAEVAIQLKKKDDEPWYQSNTFKWVVGAVVVVGAGVAAAAVLTIGAPLLLTAFVVGAAIGAATGAVAGGVIGGIAAEKKGKSVADGIADGFFWGSIGGLLSGGVAATGAVVGAGTAVMALTEGSIGAELYSANALYNGKEVTAEGTVLSIGAAVGAVVGGAVLAPAITGIKTAVVEAAEKSIAPGIGKTVSKELTEETVGAVGKAGTKSTGGGSSTRTQQFASNDEAYKYYMDLVDDLDVSTAKDTATFYSGPGNRALAEEFAKVNGKTTLEMTSGGKYLDDLKLFEEGSQLTKQQTADIWKKLSQKYAEEASGNAYGFTKGSWEGSIFNTVEYPALQSNPSITNVFTELFN